MNIEGNPSVKAEDFNHGFWAKVPGVYHRKVREVGPEAGVDTDRFILGHILHKIINDDGRIFALAEEDFFAPILAEDSKSGYVIRYKDYSESPEIT